MPALAVTMLRSTSFVAGTCCLLVTLHGCGGGGGGGNAPAPPPPNPPPQVTFAVDDSSITSGQWVTLTWSSTNATTCVASGGWAGTLATLGTQLIGPVFQTTNYTITCSASGGTRASNTITVTATPDPTQFAFEQSWNSVNDVAWDASQQVLYLAIGSNAATHPNSIMAFDPVSGSIRAAVYAGSEPKALAMSDDSQYLYVGFTGTDVIRRFTLPTLTLDHTQIVDPETRAIHGVPTFTTNLAVAPGLPLTIAVTSENRRSFPPSTRFDIFDDDIQRPTNNFQIDYQALDVAWHEDGTRIFASEVDGSIGVFATSPALTSLTSTLNLSPRVSLDSTVAYSNGSIYGGTGAVYDAGTLQLRGTFPTRGMVIVDAVNQKVFVATFDFAALAPVLTFTKYDENSFTPINSIAVTKHDPVNQIEITPGKPRRVIRWGTDGLAIVGAGGQLAILWGSFVAPGGTVIPVGTIPGADPCCSQNPLLFDVAVTHTSTFASDIAYDSAHNMLFASLPESDPLHPNTIVVLDPVTGVASGYIPTAAVPGALAISDDGQFLYAGESTNYQRFLLPSLALDATVVYDEASILPPAEIAIRPNAPKTVLIRFRGSGGLLIYENDVRVLPDTVGTQAWLQWSADGSKYYGLDSASTSMELWEKSYGSSTISIFGDVFTHPFGANSGYPWNMTFTVGGNLLYGDTGAVFDPATGGWPGTLPVARAVGAEDALATFLIDAPNNRAYAAVCPLFPVNAACGDYLIAFDLATYLPVGVGSLPGISGWAYRLQKLSPTSFAILTANHEVAILTSPEFTR